MGFLWVTGFSFFHCVDSPFHSFVTTISMPRGRCTCCGRCAVARILQQAAERMLYAFLRMLLEVLPQCRGGAALRAVRGHCVPSLRCGRGANALIGILLLTDATTPTTRKFKHTSSQTDMLPRAASAQAQPQTFARVRDSRTATERELQVILDQG